MSNKLAILLQYLAPQHLLSRLAGTLSDCSWPWLKNKLILWFIQRYGVNMQAAENEDPTSYATFNLFFTRHLKSNLRPIASGNAIASPADGCISQLGDIQHETLFQAKGFYFSLTALLGGDATRAHPFLNGKFATIYLSPKDYHRVHMPLAGSLTETLYIPGKLFSVSTATTEAVPNLFSRNERLVCLFDTEIGKMAVIFVGAMIVSGIETVWQSLTHAKDILLQKPAQPIRLARGEECGHFKLGSTVILLFPQNTIQWADRLKESSGLQMGEAIGQMLHSKKG